MMMLTFAVNPTPGATMVLAFPLLVEQHEISVDVNLPLILGTTGIIIMLVLLRVFTIRGWHILPVIIQP
jgi:hypothetical protein